MKKFFMVAEASNSIISKEEVLLPDYMPTEVLHRQNEMETIAAAIRPMMHGKSPTNLFICGPSGTGKTTCTKLVLDQLKESSAKVIPVYVNCWEYQTRMAVYYKISEALQLLLPRRGLASDEIFARILEAMEKNSFSILLVLDELDSLVFNKEDSLLYTISRASLDKGAGFGIIAISNKNDLTRFLDSRVSSSLRLSSFEFKEYTTNQIKEILKERAKYALMVGSYDDRVLAQCAEIAAANNGNARLALEILWKAAIRADKADKNKITKDDVLEVVKVVEKRPSKKAPRMVSFQEHDLNLSEEEKLVLDILKNGELPSSELYNSFAQKKSKSKRQIRNYLMLLEAKGLIDSKEVDYGANTFLKTKIYSIKQREAV